jgi:hypothetical protein
MNSTDEQALSQPVCPQQVIEEISFFAIAAGGRISDDAPESTTAVARKLIAPIQSGLKGLRRDGWTLYNPRLTFTTSTRGRSIAGPLASIFAWQAWHLIDSQREALHECARCSDWFVAARPFQKYCSSACGQAVHNETFKQTAPAEHRSALRRKSYLKVKARNQGALKE